MRIPLSEAVSAGVGGRLVIMRLITTVALALLLAFGAVSTAHGSAEGLDAGVTLSTDVAVVDVTAAGADTFAVADAAWTAPFTEAALCVLGILCGLVAVVLLRRRHRPATLPQRTTDAPVRGTVPLGFLLCVRRTTRSVTSLGICRI
ncbi:hypothetical protein [Streptomyces sp. AC495_CC817]|uniref:hypothetical protein n=1 Tax=Streptomyces sp. AC495_CC817 TaxID=2823900 RepID=UPI001C25AE46|nr:hypothetical protein [Streptomyces sp. AC495_CC817]